jgi:hypothetical protein
MKKLLLLTLGLLIFLSAWSQSFRTEYSKGTKSNFCAEELFDFKLEDESITRIDNFDGTRMKNFSKKVSGEFDNNGFYNELWNAKFYLNKYGVNQFNRITQFTYRIVYDKRGGNLLYILEIDNKKGLDAGKVYMTEAGFKIMCNN